MSKDAHANLLNDVELHKSSVAANDIYQRMARAYRPMLAEGDTVRLANFTPPSNRRQSPPVMPEAEPKGAVRFSTKFHQAFIRVIKDESPSAEDMATTREGMQAMLQHFHENTMSARAGREPELPTDFAKFVGGMRLREDVVAQLTAPTAAESAAAKAGVPGSKPGSGRVVAAAGDKSHTVIAPDSQGIHR